MVRSFGYDACGRTISDWRLGVGTTTYTWDYEDRLVQIAYPNSTTNVFGYNGFGTRVSKVDSSGTSSFMRAGMDVVSPVLSVTKGGTTMSYTQGLSERRDGISRFYHFDASTSTKQLSDGSSSFSDTWSYDAWGNVLSRIGDTSTPFQFVGARVTYWIDLGSCFRVWVYST